MLQLQVRNVLVEEARATRCTTATFFLKTPVPLIVLAPLYYSCSVRTSTATSYILAPLLLVLAPQLLVLAPLPLVLPLLLLVLAPLLLALAPLLPVPAPLPVLPVPLPVLPPVLPVLLVLAPLLLVLAVLLPAIAANASRPHTKGEHRDPARTGPHPYGTAHPLLKMITASTPAQPQSSSYYLSFTYLSLRVTYPIAVTSPLELPIPPYLPIPCSYLSLSIHLPRLFA